MLDNPPATVDVLTAAQRVAIARHPGRPGVVEIVNALFTDFFEQRGDLSSTDDPSIMGGIALFHGRPVTVLGNRKGSDIEERVACNFGMASPEGYRKAQRIMRAAEKFGRPVLTFVDTSGAYPGMEAEMHGQGEAIARSIELMSSPHRAGDRCDLRRGRQWRRPRPCCGQSRAHARERRVLGAFARGLRVDSLEGRKPLRRGVRGHEAHRRRPA